MNNRYGVFTNDDKLPYMHYEAQYRKMKSHQGKQFDKRYPEGKIKVLKERKWPRWKIPMNDLQTKQNEGSMCTA